MREVQRSPATGITLCSWTGDQFGERISDAMRIYARAMNYPERTGIQRGLSARRHTGLDGFACQVALDGANMVGFGYGYTTRPGQWWNDLVRRAITAPTAAHWLTNAFELSELHVAPEYQSAGLGRRLLYGLAHGLAHEAMLLSTPDTDTKAFRLYRDVGFVDLARDYLFPGDARPFAVLGARLPLHGAAGHLPAGYGPG